MSDHFRVATAVQPSSNDRERCATDISPPILDHAKLADLTLLGESLRTATVARLLEDAHWRRHAILALLRRCDWVGARREVHALCGGMHLLGALRVVALLRDLERQLDAGRTIDGTVADRHIDHVLGELQVALIGMAIPLASIKQPQRTPRVQLSRR